MKVIEQALYTLLQQKEFFAHFYLQSTVHLDFKGIDRAAASLDKKGIHLYFNSKFMESLSKDQAGAVIEHEIMHILLKHIGAMHDKTLDKKVANIAMDLAINQWVSNLPEECLSIKNVSQKIKKKLPEGETWEYYYNELLKYKESLPKTGPSDGSIDEHGVGEYDDLSVAEHEALIKATMDRAIKSSRGNVPVSVMKIFSKLNEESKVPWQQVLQAFVSRSISSTVINTRKKRHRRFNNINIPGKKKKRELILGVAADSSGSVSDEEFTKFLTEIDKISGMCSKVHYVEADCEIQSFETITKHRKLTIKRTGNGGTAYQPAIDKLMGLKCDAIIYFGDFDCADTPENPGKPFLWVGCGDQQPPASFGGVIRI